MVPLVCFFLLTYREANKRNFEKIPVWHFDLGSSCFRSLICKMEMKVVTLTELLKSIYNWYVLVIFTIRFIPLFSHSRHALPVSSIFLMVSQMPAEILTLFPVSHVMFSALSAVGSGWVWRSFQEARRKREPIPYVSTFVQMPAYAASGLSVKVLCNHLTIRTYRTFFFFSGFGGHTKNCNTAIWTLSSTVRDWNHTVYFLNKLMVAWAL